MEKIKLAVLNNINYCKYPKGIHDIEEFIAYLNRNFHSFFEVEILVEEGCVAPYFIKEDLKTEVQYWNPTNIRLIKEEEITLLSRAEYQARLAKVIAEKCVHCTHYTEEGCDEDLSSFIEHINLDGNCYAFEKK